MVRRRVRVAIAIRHLAGGDAGSARKPGQHLAAGVHHPDLAVAGGNAPGIGVQRELTDQPAAPIDGDGVRCVGPGGSAGGDRKSFRCRGADQRARRGQGGRRPGYGLAGACRQRGVQPAQRAQAVLGVPEAAAIGGHHLRRRSEWQGIGGQAVQVGLQASQVAEVWIGPPKVPVPVEGQPLRPGVARQRPGGEQARV